MRKFWPRLKKSGLFIAIILNNTMISSIKTIGKDNYLPVLILAICVLVTVFCYQKALGGSYHFDDEPNLHGLGEIQTTREAVDFIFGGLAEPLGRPLSLASFVPQAYAWPSNPELFLKANIAIHLINGLLVIWILIRLGRILDRHPEEKIALVAVVAGVIWMMLPILASSSLFIVQRMALLSAFFVLLGILLYLFERGKLRTSNRALVWMTVILFFSTILAMLSKENGVLLPALILVMEVTLMARVNVSINSVSWLIWRLVFLVVPTLIVMGYLISRVPYPEITELQRGFDAQQRVMTQGIFLWEYLYNAFLPTLSNLGPFHDDKLPVRHHDSLAIAALFSWILLIAFAIIFRHRYVFFSFAILWYMVAHLLESTTVSLELYFEHRNYVALVGPIFMISSALYYNYSQKNSKIIASIFVMYAGLMAFILYNVTSTWGTPRVAAEIWLMHHPRSVRAQLNLVQILEQERDIQTAQHMLDSFCDDDQGSGNVCLHSLLFSCRYTPNFDHTKKLQNILTILETARYERWLSEIPELLHRQIKMHECNGVDVDAIEKIANAILLNPRYRSNRVVVHNFNALFAVIEIDRGNIDKALERLDDAVSAKMNLITLDVSIRIAKELHRQDLIDQWMRMAILAKPTNPLKARGWLIYLEKLQEISN